MAYTLKIWILYDKLLTYPAIGPIISAFSCLSNEGFLEIWIDLSIGGKVNLTGTLTPTNHKKGLSFKTIPCSSYFHHSSNILAGSLRLCSVTR